MLFIGGVASIFYRAYFFSWVLDFLFSLYLCYVYFLSTLCLGCLCPYVKKGGEIDEILKKKKKKKVSNCFYLGGDEIVFEKGIKFFVFKGRVTFILVMYMFLVIFNFYLFHNLDV